MRRLPALVAVVAWCGAVLSTAGLPPQEPPPNQPLVRHDPVVGCIVAGHFPVLDSCVDPSSKPTIAKCTANFRGQGAPTWFSVVSKPHPTRAYCYQSILLKPKKKTLTAMEFFFECVSKDTADNRTEDFLAKIVDNKSECDKDKLAAPFSNTGPAGVLGSGPGFVGAAGSIVPLAGGVTAVLVGGALLVTNSGGGGVTTTTIVTANTTTSTTTTTTSTSTTTTTTTTVPTQENRPPDIVCSVRPDPPEGEPPLTVVFRLCGSRDPDGDDLRFEYEFGDGAIGGGSCESDAHTYAEGSYSARACVTDRRPDHRRCCTYQVNARRAPPPPTTTTTTIPTSTTTTTSTTSTSTSTTSTSTSTTSTSTSTTSTSTTSTSTTSTSTTSTSTSTTSSTTTTTTTTLPPCATDPPPTVSITSPPPGQLMSFPVTVAANASDNGTVTSVQFFVTGTAPPSSTTSLGPPVIMPPYQVSWSPSGCAASTMFFDLHAVATDNCSNTTTSPKVSVEWGCGEIPSPEAQSFHWTSQLEASGSAGRVSLNGAPLAIGPGRQEGTAQARRREENRVVGELVQGGSRPGLWRFDFSAGVAPGSVRVVAGDAVEVSDSAVVFRVGGTTGERVGFVFRARD